jgi:hypothetical protein
VGYTCDPTFMHVIAYVGYWVVVIAVMIFKARRGTLHKYMFEEEELEGSPEGSSDLEAPAGEDKVAGESNGKEIERKGVRSSSVGYILGF